MARRIDRLAARAHRFHRFAHHPLCDAYAGEVVRVGRRSRLCRGCAMAAAGAALGVAAGLALPVPAAGALAALLGATAAGAWLALRVPRASAAGASHGPSRRGKLVTRAAPVGLAAVVVTLGARAGTVTGGAAALAALACLALSLVLYRRRGPDRSPCQGCPERTAPVVCSGFRPMARREAAFSRAARRLMTSAPSAARTLPPAGESPAPGETGARVGR